MVNIPTTIATNPPIMDNIPNPISAGIRAYAIGAIIPIISITGAKESVMFKSVALAIPARARTGRPTLTILPIRVFMEGYSQSPV